MIGNPAASRFSIIAHLKGDLRNTKEDFLKMFHAQHPFQENIRSAGIHAPTCVPYDAYYIRQVNKSQ